MPWNDNTNRFKESIKAKQKTGPSAVIDIGEKYQLVTGMDEDKAGGLDSRLMPNLHKKWIPICEEGPYNNKLYKNASEQEFYENFIQPLYKIYLTAKYSKNLDQKDGIQKIHWERRINLDVLGPEKALFEGTDKRTHALMGEIEIVLILAVHIIDDLTRYQESKVAKRIGCSINWIKNFRRRIQNSYGKMIMRNAEDHIELQMNRCEAILDTFMTKAKDGDPYAAKIVKDYMDKEDQYIMPTLDQIPAKETEEKRNETLKRLEKIFERKKIGEKNEN